MKNALTKFVTGASVAGTSLLLLSQSAFAVNIGSAKVSRGFATDLGTMLTSILTIVMAIAALAVFMYLIYGGIQWITAGGDKGKTEEARNKITAAVIGIIVLAAAYAILLLVLNILGFNNLTDVFDNIEKINTAGGQPV